MKGYLKGKSFCVKDSKDTMAGSLACKLERENLLMERLKNS